jgi:AcrR family transcriptional regulator
MLLYGEQPTARKRKRGMETSERILSCAAEVFARKGYERATLGEIASAAGIRESSVYNHFGGKAAILQRLIEEFREGMPSSRPTDADLERMLDALAPRELTRSEKNCCTGTLGVKVAFSLRIRSRNTLNSGLSL